MKHAINDLNMVHAIQPFGGGSYGLLCMPNLLVANIRTDGLMWFGTWRPIEAEITCTRCLNIAVRDNADIDHSRAEYAIERTNGSRLIPVGSLRAAQAMLRSHRPGWGKLKFRYVTEWTDYDRDSNDESSSAQTT